MKPATSPWARALVLASPLLATVPSVALASEPLPPAPDPPPPALAPKHRNTGMMIAGIVLTGIGSAMLVSGAVVIGLFAGKASEGTGLTGILVGWPLAMGSTLFAGVGVPLWVVGALPPRPPASPGLPRQSVKLEVGPAMLRLSF